MKIIYKHGDLMRCEEGMLVQGCNAQGVMGSGVAKLLRDKDEKIFSDYRLVHDNQDGGLAVGQVIIVHSIPLGKTVFNAITQEFFGREPGTVYVSYDGLRKAYQAINGIIVTGDFGTVPSVAMPLIGAGLAQGSWATISQIIEEESTNFQPVVYLFDGVIPDGVIAEVVPA